MVRDWDEQAVAALREALGPGGLHERIALPPALEVDAAREVLPRPLFTAWLGQVDACGRRPAPGPVGARARHGPPGPAAAPSTAFPDAGWRAGEGLGRRTSGASSPGLAGVLARALEDRPPDREEVERLFRAHGAEVEAVAAVADELRARRCGERVTYVINRNINYTNLCYFRCGFCGFSKGPKSLNLRGDPYLLSVEEVVRRSVEAWGRGATEVCLQGGIHPDFTGDFYAEVLEAIKARLPGMHVHGFTALEVWQGAATLGVSRARAADAPARRGPRTLPGTAAEVLDDRVRLHLCPDKISSSEWAEVHLITRTRSACAPTPR